MDLRFTVEEEAFREKVRQWLDAHLPPADGRDDPAVRRRWHRDLHEAGYIGTSWPTAYGGGGLTRLEQAILQEEFARADAPPGAGGMGVLWVGPAIIRFGTEAQKQRFIEPILSGDETWCTGYSEPNAGSDLASVKTAAVRDGDAYVVNGQKVWTSLAHEADWCFLLVRTSTEGKKHAGLTLLLVDMKLPGIEVRPLRQLTGEAEFNEVFLHDVRVPADHRLGNEGDGWKIVTSALADERTAMATAIRADKVLERLVRTARDVGKTTDPRWRQQIASLAVDCHTLRCSGLRSLSAEVRGRANPALTSVTKLFVSELLQRLSEAGLAVLGTHAVLGPGASSAPDRGEWAHEALYARCLTIAGGSSEVQRNVVAQRVLGLPR